VFVVCFFLPGLLKTWFFAFLPNFYKRTNFSNSYFRKFYSAKKTFTNFGYEKKWNFNRGSFRSIQSMGSHRNESPMRKSTNIYGNLERINKAKAIAEQVNYINKNMHKRSFVLWNNLYVNFCQKVASFFNILTINC